MWGGIFLLDMDHRQKIERIVEQLSERPEGASVKFVRDGVSHKVPNSQGNAGMAHEVIVPKLNEILEIDPKTMTCTAESGVTFFDLVQETLKHGLVPYTVPELKTITIGGAVAGSSVESMSYKYGGFHDSCLEYEVISASGEVLTCSPEENPDLFHMMHGTFGTVGMLTKLKFRLHPAQKFVKMTYEKYATFAEYQAAIQSYYKRGEHDFVDGIIHGPDHFTLCIGNFVDEAPYVNRYDGMKIFYKSTAERTEDFMRTQDYFFRYDRECHWLSRNFGLENKVLRALFGRWFLSSTNMIKAAKRLKWFFKGKRPDVVVDVFVPMSRFADFYDFYEREFDYYPLWIVPYRIPKKYPWLNESFMKNVDDELFIDCAIYGFRQKDGQDYYRLLDEKLVELRGIKTLISHNQYDENTFWKIYSRENFERVKAASDPENVFGDLYKKTHR